ncbi:hypothetical protein LINPERHAP1_LOCUS27529 [Linum perenne]
MPLFAFKSTNHFVASSDGIILQVYELTKPTNHLSSIQKVDWKVVATISASLEEDDDGKSYNGLSFLDGQGKIEGEKALTTLAQHLKQLHLLVSPKGYCFQQVSELGMYSDFGIHYLRLNDLFSWPRHNIDLATSNVWSRLEFKYSLPKHKNPSKQKPNVGGGVSKEKEAKLERLVKEKEEELEKLKEEKDKELRMLKKMKDEEEAKSQRIEELEKLNEDLEEANKKKDEELQKLAKSKNTVELQRQLKKKDDELKLLKKRKYDEEAKAQRIEELEKLNEDLEETNKINDEELQKLAKSKNTWELQRQLKKKDDELKILKKKMDEEDEEKAQRIEELEKVNKDLEEANNIKDEELQRLANSNDIREMQKQLKRIQSSRYDEVEKLKEELEMANKAKDYELQKLRKEKDREISKILQENDYKLFNMSK